MFSFFNNQEDILDKAIRLKREGKYQESIKCYIEYIQKNPTSSELNTYLYALGKVHFLNNDFQASIWSYIYCALYLAFKKRPEMVDDMIYFLKTKDYNSPYIIWASDFGRHLGYALIALKKQKDNTLYNTSNIENKYLKIYADSIAGKDVPLDELMDSDIDGTAARLGAKLVTDKILESAKDQSKFEDNLRLAIALSLKMV